MVIRNIIVDTNEQPDEVVQSVRFRRVPMLELLSPQFGVCPDCKEALTSSCDTDAFNYPGSLYFGFLWNFYYVGTID